MHFYVQRYEIIVKLQLIQINLQSLSRKSKNSDLKIKKPKKPKNITFFRFFKKPKKPKFFKMGLDSPGFVQKLDIKQLHQPMILCPAVSKLYEYEDICKGISIKCCC